MCGNFRTFARRLEWTLSEVKRANEELGRGSLRMRQHPSKVFLVLFVHKENSSSRGSVQIARPA